jgi:hypothetical protein
VNSNPQSHMAIPPFGVRNQRSLGAPKNASCAMD